MRYSQLICFLSFQHALKRSYTNSLSCNISSFHQGLYRCRTSCCLISRSKLWTHNSKVFRQRKRLSFALCSRTTASPTVATVTVSKKKTLSKEALQQTKAWQIPLFQVLLMEQRSKRELLWLHNFAIVYDLFLNNHSLKRQDATEQQIAYMDWLSKQRYFLRQGILAPEKKELLSYLNLVPTWRRGRKPERIQQRKTSYLGKDFQLDMQWNNLSDQQILKKWEEFKRNPRNKTWAMKWKRLYRYKRLHGHIDLDKENCKDRNLLNWLRRQHRAIREEKLDEERLTLLAMLGDEAAVLVMKRKEDYQKALNTPLEWEPKETSTKWTDREIFIWTIHFLVLLEFRTIFGHIMVNKESCKQLPNWVEWTAEQSVCILKGDISSYQAKLLLNVGFQVTDIKGRPKKFPTSVLSCELEISSEAVEWLEKLQELIDHPQKEIVLESSTDSIDATWLSMFRKWIAYKLQNSVTITEDLENWIQQQCDLFRSNQLTDRKKLALEVVGFEFYPSQEESWEKMFERYESFVKRNGNSQVPRVPKYRDLYDWCIRQRHLFRKGKLSQERYSRLAKLGMVWDDRGDRWNRKFMELVEFQRKHGHLEVEKGVRNDTFRPLYNWVIKQRFLYRYGLLDEERVCRLKGIGFDFKETQNEWKFRIKELAAYKAIYGNCDVPSDYEMNPGLASWVQKIREEWRRGKMSIAKYRELVGLGFRWNHSVREWEAQLDALAKYCSKHGHCSIAWYENPSLTNWCRQQRMLFKENQLEMEKIEKLHALGFRFQTELQIIYKEWKRRVTQLKETSKKYHETSLSKLISTAIFQETSLLEWVKLVRENKTRLSGNKQAELQHIIPDFFV
ncbi:hypothetical protein GpartN1_g4697.t1 [Galdieria partita]|uniref:Helicase-associated domain-containing protein n=1 Tax=Galdieria partita TaxID=83374 RepID=A0A9C7PYH8_9RHOD|nr:hypothetical protein GpartN1_g4697.t1 [Galdieria partita]